MRKLFLAAFTLLLAGSCNDDDTPSVVKENNEPVNIEFEEVIKSTFPGGGWGTETHYNTLIHSAEEWNAFFKRYEITPNITVPDNIQHTTIACVSDHLPGIGETDIFEITGVIQQNDTIKVSIHSYYNPDEVKLTMSYQPYHIVKIPKTDLPVTFVYE